MAIGKYTVIKAKLRWVRIPHINYHICPLYSPLVSKCLVTSAVLAQHSVFQNVRVILTL